MTGITVRCILYQQCMVSCMAGVERRGVMTLVTGAGRGITCLAVMMNCGYIIGRVRMTRRTRRGIPLSNITFRGQRCSVSKYRVTVYSISPVTNFLVVAICCCRTMTDSTGAAMDIRDYLVIS